MGVDGWVLLVEEDYGCDDRKWKWTGKGKGKGKRGGLNELCIGIGIGIGVGIYIRHGRGPRRLGGNEASTVRNIDMSS